MEANRSQLSSLEQEAVDEGTSGDHLRELAKTSIELARLVANNPSAPANLMQQLATSNDKAIRKGVVSNPNTPVDLLVKLGKYFPKQLLNNPILSLLYLENPNLLYEIPLSTLLKMLKQKKVPVFFLEWAAEHSDINVLKAVAQHLHTSPIILEKLVINCNDNVICRLIAKNPITPKNVLNQLINHKDEIVRWYVCVHQNTPESALDKLVAYNPSTRISRFIAQHSKTQRGTLEKLAEHEDIDVRYYVAQHSNTPSSVLERLGLDQSWSAIRLAVAQNSNTPIETLKNLAEDSNPIIHVVAKANLQNRLQ